MKTTTALLALTALATTTALGQTKPSTKPGAKSAAKPAVSSARVSNPATAKPVARTVPKAAPAQPTATPPAPPAAEPAATAAAPAPASAAGLFRKGTVMVNAGVGLGLGYGYGFGSALKATPALSLSLEKGIIEGVGPGVIGVGGLVGYKGYHYDYAGTDYKAKWNNIIVLVRGTYHYDLLQNSKLDTYAGVSLGVRIENYKNNYDSGFGERYDTSYGGARAEGGIFLGARYFLTDNIGGFAEAGYDMSYLKLGLTARF